MKSFVIRENLRFFEMFVLDAVFDMIDGRDRFYKTESGDYIGKIESVDVIIEVVKDNVVRLRPLYEGACMDIVYKVFRTKATTAWTVVYRHKKPDDVTFCLHYRETAK
jgi:hypothetical protein